MWGLRFSQQCCWRLKSPWRWHWVSSSPCLEGSTFIMRVKQSSWDAWLLNHYKPLTQRCRILPRRLECSKCCKRASPEFKYSKFDITPSVHCALCLQLFIFANIRTQYKLSTNMNPPACFSDKSPSLEQRFITEFYCVYLLVKYKWPKHSSWTCA
jgi:hypothetical protein